MKRMLVVIMILSFSISVISAGLISFGFGAHALDTRPFPNESDELGSIEDWNFGAEMRLGVLFLEAAVLGRFTGEERMDGLVTVGTSLSLFDLLHLGVGAGPAFGLAHDGSRIGWLKMAPEGEESINDIGAVLYGGLINYRVHGDIKFGHISVGATYQVPSKGYSLENDAVLDLVPDWDRGNLGASVLFWLF